MKKRFTNRGKNKMKNIMKIAVAAICAAFAVNVQGATNRLGSIKSTGYVVTKEDDPSFNSWLGGSEIRIPVDTNNFYIGGLPLSSLMGLGKETDPTFTSFRNRDLSLYLGRNSAAGPKGIAIGFAGISERSDVGFTFLYSSADIAAWWRNDYI